MRGSKSRRVLVAAALPVAVGLALAACSSSSDASSTTAAGSEPTAEASSTGAASSAPASVETAFERGVVVAGSGAGQKIGYISLGDSIPFVKLVSDGIKKQAEAAGAELLFCDSQLDAAKALDCASTFRAQGVQGIINFQVDEKAAERICAAGPDVPVLAIDIHQRPCEISFMGADNYRGGFIAGEALGNYFKEQFNCEYDALVSLEAPASGEATIARAKGGREGFASVCGEIPEDKLRAVDGGISIDKGNSVFTDTLTALPAAKRIAVVSLNDDMLLGAFAAAESANRADQVYGAAMGADPTSHDQIRNNPNWIGDAAWFPELYGDTAISAMVAMIKGENVPAELLTDHTFIDKSNIDQYYQ